MPLSDTALLHYGDVLVDIHSHTFIAMVVRVERPGLVEMTTLVLPPLGFETGYYGKGRVWTWYSGMGYWSRADADE